MQRSKISFKGQNVFVGIDVHKSSWEVAVITETSFMESHRQEPSAKGLYEFLKTRFPEGNYIAAYESGFTGFSTYYALIEYGIDCIVVHAADVPSTQYENTMKTDRVDAAKLARSLSKGELHSIYIREKENQDDLCVVRVRRTINNNLSAFKARVKHMLHCNGVTIPKRFEKPGSYWSKVFMEWLKNDVVLLSSTRISLDLLIKQVESNRKLLYEATKALRNLGKLEKYKDNYELLCSIPGVGATTSMCILTEIYDINRFSNERQFASYLGLISTCHNSGNKVVAGEMTFRGNKGIRTMLIESSWVAIRRDKALSVAYANYRKRMNSQKAIVRIARKLSNIVFAVLKNKKRYEPYC
jgi:transposase